MRALDRLKKAVSMKPIKKSVSLPDGSEFEFFMTPLTLAERARAQKQAKSDDAVDYALQLLVAKAKDGNGVPLFAAGDIADLRNLLPGKVVEDMMLKLIGDDELDEEEEEEYDLKSRKKSAE
jgi:hypothetical protein